MPIAMNEECCHESRVTSLQSLREAEGYFGDRLYIEVQFVAGGRRTLREAEHLGRSWVCRWWRRTTCTFCGRKSICITAVNAIRAVDC